MSRQGNGPKPQTAPADGQVRLMTNVAHLYDEQGTRQADIATALRISQARVSRLLKKTSEVGIVLTPAAVTARLLVPRVWTSVPRGGTSATDRPRPGAQPVGTTCSDGGLDTGSRRPRSLSRCS